jgi:hypothetical protein
MYVTERNCLICKEACDDPALQLERTPFVGLDLSIVCWIKIHTDLRKWFEGIPIQTATSLHIAQRLIGGKTTLPEVHSELMQRAEWTWENCEVASSWFAAQNVHFVAPNATKENFAARRTQLKYAAQMVLNYRFHAPLEMVAPNQAACWWLRCCCFHKPPLASKANALAHEDDSFVKISYLFASVKFSLEDAIVEWDRDFLSHTEWKLIVQDMIVFYFPHALAAIIEDFLTLDPF